MSQLIELWNLDEGHFGVILLGSTGYIWTNQVGGTSCAHPRAEGIYIPLPASWHPYSDFQEDPLYDLWVKDYDANMNLVQQFLDGNNNLQRCFAPITNLQVILEIMEEEKLVLAEAWVPVEIIDHNNAEPIASWMVGKCGIITYYNSD